MTDIKATYTQFSFPCPRCNEVARLVEGADRCGPCFRGYVKAMKTQLRAERRAAMRKITSGGRRAA